ncbi:HEAT repeat domain-containing protein [bacterium]|nr:HEAT repeat domain-containing protein [bacterium]
MKPWRVAGLRTRRFPPWLQTFNVLCGIAALAILGFGIYFLATRGGARDLAGVLVRPPGGGEPRVDREVLERRLALPAGGTALGEALAGTDDATVLRVLDAAASTCLPGALSLEAVLAGRSGRVGEAAVAELTAAVGLEPPSPALPKLREMAQSALANAEPRSLTVYLAARGIVRGNAARRRAAVERLATFKDGHVIPLLLVALGAQESERATQKLAESALAAYATAPIPVEGTSEERWVAWWQGGANSSVSLPLPYDLKLLAEPLERTLERSDLAARREAVRNLGMLRDVNVREKIAHLLETETDALAKADAAWALGRIGGAGAAEPLARSLADPSALVRAAAARAIGRGRFDSARFAVRRLLDENDEKLRFAAALALVEFGDRSALAEVDIVAFDEHRLPGERLAALEALEATGDAAASTSRWIVALTDPDAGVHEAADKALSRYLKEEEVIVGRPAWEKWWRERFQGIGLAFPRGLGR